MIGTTLQKFRIQKGLKPNQIYKGIMSKSSYWNLENSGVMSSFELVVSCLKRMNVEVDEFIDALDSENNLHFENLIEERKIAFNRQDITKLQDLKKIFENNHEQTSSVRYLHASNVCQLMVLRLLRKKPQKQYYKPIHDYLMNCEYWTYYEINLFSATMYTFDFEYVARLFQQARKGITRYPKIHRSWNEETAMLLNYLSLCIQNKEDEHIKQAFKIMEEEIIISDKNLYNRVLVRWAKYIIRGYFTKEEENFIKAAQVIQVFKDYEMDGQFNLTSTWTQMYRRIILDGK